MEQKVLLAGQVARLFNRSGSWLKLLERQGVIPPAAKDLGGRRVYTDTDIAHIRKCVERRAQERALA